MMLSENTNLFIAEINQFSEEEWVELREYFDKTFGKKRWKEYRLEEVD